MGIVIETQQKEHQAVFRSHVVSETWIGFDNHDDALKFLHQFPDPYRYRVVQIKSYEFSGPTLGYLVLPNEVQIP